jgi:hypothetical protein
MKNPTKEFLRKRRLRQFEEARQNVITEIGNLQQATQACRLTCQALNGQVERVNSYLED